MTAAEYLARAHAVTDAATPGPWGYYESTGHITDRDRGLSIAPIGDLRGDSRTRIEDVRFAAHARTMLPAAVAAIEAVLAIHRAVTVYGLADDCECSEGDPDWDDHHYSTDVAGDLLCDKSPTGEQWCGECSQDEDGDGTTYPCPTVRDITAHLDPS